jgi:hypothetical protein
MVNNGLEYSKTPCVGQYNPRFDVTKHRMDRLTHTWKHEQLTVKATKHKNKLKAKLNKLPVCDRIIRTLNRKDVRILLL